MNLTAHRCIVSLFGLGLALAATTAAANTFDIAPDISGGFGNYKWSIGIDGAGASGNPVLSVMTGQTYSFVVSSNINHPFWIDQSPGVGGLAGSNPLPVPTATLSDNGVTLATITLSLPADAPDTLYYACGNHPEMTNSITVIHDLVFRSAFD